MPPLSPNRCPAEMVGHLDSLSIAASFFADRFELDSDEPALVDGMLMVIHISFRILLLPRPGDDLK